MQVNEKNLRKFVTEKRLSTYNDFGEYELNLKQSKDYYIPLSILEVALKNSINSLFERYYGAGWIINQASFLQHKELEKISEAKAKLANRNENINKDKLIAELSFGFWTALFQSVYKHQMRTNDLKQIFPNLPKKEANFIDRKIISAKLDYIRKFRNRIFHYEKIVGKAEFDTIRDDINEILRYFDDEICEFAKRLNGE